MRFLEFCFYLNSFFKKYFDLQKVTQAETIVDYLKINPFDEDEAEQNLLKSKPTCFLIIGKPGVGKTTLAKKLSQEWKTEFINRNK